MAAVCRERARAGTAGTRAGAAGRATRARAANTIAIATTATAANARTSVGLIALVHANSAVNDHDMISSVLLHLGDAARHLQPG